MKNKTTILAGALICSALTGATMLPANTYASTEEETAAVTSAIDSLKTTYQTAINNYNTEHPNSQVQLQLGDSDDNYGPFYKAASANAYTRLTHSQSITAEWSDGQVIGVLDFPAITAAFEDLDFTSYGPSYYYPEFRQFLNEDTGVICAAGIAIYCGHINWQTITDEWAEFVNGIGATYYEGNNNVYPVVTADVSNNDTLPAIHNSEYEPYQYTFVGVSNYRSSFYRSSPTSPWVYFTSTQYALGCDEYTGEAIKGFMGYVCYNYDANGVFIGESTVGAASASTPTENETESSISVPDTGYFTNDNHGQIAIISVATILTICSAAYLANYARKRLSHKVHFHQK